MNTQTQINPKGVITGISTLQGNPQLRLNIRFYYKGNCRQLIFFASESKCKELILKQYEHNTALNILQRLKSFLKQSPAWSYFGMPIDYNTPLVL